MQANFVLVAQGDVTLPTINHVITAIGIEHAKMGAEAVVAALFKAGYHRFTLYDTTRTNANGADIEIARYRGFLPAVQVIAEPH